MKKRKYELVYVLGEKAGDVDFQEVRDRLERIIKRFEGEIEAFEDWGQRKLAYEIEKNKMGYYFRIIFTALPAAQHEIHRVLRIDERVIRFLSLLKKEDKRHSQPEAKTRESAGEDNTAEKEVKEDKEDNAQLQ